MKYIGKYKKMAEQLQKDGCDEYTIEKFIQQEKDADEFSDDLKDTMKHFFKRK